MIQGYWFDYVCAFCAAVSAFYWAWSAKVRIPTGFDVGLEQNAAFEKIGRLNSTAAALAAFAAAMPAIKTFGTFMHWVTG